MAFAARYAHTAPSEVLEWEIADLHDFLDATNEILRDENKKKP